MLFIRIITVGFVAVVGVLVGAEIALLWVVHVMSKDERGE